MKKCLWVLGTAVVLMLVVPANAAYYVAGDFNGWNPAGNLMTETAAGSGIWTVDLSNVPGRHEFKVTIGDWSTNYPASNSWFYGDASGSVTVTFNTNSMSDGWDPAQYRIGLSTPLSWTITGGFNGWWNADPATAMTPLGGGLYVFSATLPAGYYEFKPVVTGTWDSLAADGRTGNTANMSITTTAGFEVVNFYVDDLRGAVRVEVIPEPATMSLLALGSLMLTSIRRRK
jgi:hypothetical protein